MSPSQISAINQAIRLYFDRHPAENKVLAKDLMPLFIQLGIFSADYRNGLPIRNLLRQLDKDKKLGLIPALLAERKAQNTNWYFIRTARTESQKEAPKSIATPDKSLHAVRRKRSFEPIADEYSNVLILGSLPGDASLQQQQYYANPTNQFWKLMAALFPGFPSSYTERCLRLKQEGVALWDVLEEAEREGSLDSAIRNSVPNNLPEFLRRHPGIQTVFFNGKKAEADFHRAFPEAFPGIRFYCLPSSSSAHTLKWEDKREAWEQIRKSVTNA